MRNFSLIPHNSPEELGFFTENCLEVGKTYRFVHQHDWAWNGFDVDKSLVKKSYELVNMGEDYADPDTSELVSRVGLVAIAEVH